MVPVPGHRIPVVDQRNEFVCCLVGEAVEDRVGVEVKVVLLSRRKATDESMIGYLCSLLFSMTLYGYWIFGRRSFIYL